MSLSAEEKRKKRINQLAGKLQLAEAGNKLTSGGAYSSLRLVLGWGQLQWGCKSERVREYVEALEMAGLIDVDEKEDRISWVG